MFICVFVCFYVILLRTLSLRCLQLECCGADGYKDWFSTSNMTSSYNVTNSRTTLANILIWETLTGPMTRRTFSHRFVLCVTSRRTACRLSNVIIPIIKIRVFFVFVLNKTTVEICPKVLAVGFLLKWPTVKKTAVMFSSVNRLDTVY